MNVLCQIGTRPPATTMPIPLWLLRHHWKILLNMYFDLQPPNESCLREASCCGNNLVVTPHTVGFEEKTSVLSQYNDHLPSYGDFHSKDEMIVRPSYLYDGNLYTGETASLYWVEPLHGSLLNKWICNNITAIQFNAMTHQIPGGFDEIWGKIKHVMVLVWVNWVMLLRILD